jgi:high-affinity iron transporter
VILTGCAVPATSTALTITNDHCMGPAWVPPPSGPMSFSITNQTPLTMDVQLLATGTQHVYGEIFTLGAGTTRPFSVTLGPGSYIWQCASIANSIYESNPATVTGKKVKATAWYTPVSPDDLTAAAYTYRSTVTAGLIPLVADTDTLMHLVDSNQLAAAKGAWLTAHLDYERLGAAYDTFGAYDDEINGRPNGLPLGVNDPNWTGFGRLEYGLWQNQPQPELAQVANQLDLYVHGLQQAFPLQQTLVTDIPLRTHEILENALQFEMTGETDEGSHTNLATVTANIVGTQTTLGAIAPLIQVRNPVLLKQCQSGLAALYAMFNAYDTPSGWTPLSSLTTAQHEQLDGALSAMLETLSEIPGTLRMFAVGAD